MKVYIGMMSLNQWAEKNKVTYKTAWRHFKAGKIPGAYQLGTGTIRVPEDWDQLPSGDWNVVLYARSLDGMTASIDEQFEALESFARNQGWIIKDRIDEKRSRLQLDSKLLHYNFSNIDRLVVLNNSILGPLADWLEVFKKDFVYVTDPSLKISEPIYADIREMIDYLVQRGVPLKKAKLLIKAVK